MNIIKDNIKVIIIGLIALVIIITGAIALSLAFGGQSYRRITVNDIHGNVVILRDVRQFNMTKKTVIESGDIINTDETSSVRVQLDYGKYIVVEPNSSVYVYYTGLTDSGEISVNVARGAVTCQLNNPLKKKEIFVVKTPNTAVHVRGTVFRTEFEMMDEYMGYEDVMVTNVQNFEGSVMLQLYGIDSEKVENPMLLTERTSAQLISCKEFAQYGYLNYDTDMYSMDEISLMELIRISGERPIAYSLDELDIALRSIRNIKAAESASAAMTVLSSETVTETSSETTTAVTSAPPAQSEESQTVTVTSPPAETEPPVSETTTTNTLATTRPTHIYTTYEGPKWWEMPNENPNYNEDDFDDGGVFNYEPVTVTAAP